MQRRALRWASRVLGRHYVRVLVLGQVLLTPLVVAGGLLLLKLYLPDLAWGDWALVLAVAEGLALVDVVISYRKVSGWIRDADPWLHGDRSPEAATRAWCALAGLPLRFVRFGVGWPTVVDVVPTAVFAALVIDGGPPFAVKLVAILAGAAVVLLYGAFLHFFGLELIVRPLLERLAADLPDGARLERTTLSVRRKLLIALPAMNVVTGVMAVGLTQPDEGFKSLGLGVAFALGAALVVSIGLATLLMRSLLEPLRDLQAGTARVASGDLGARVPVLGGDELGRLAGSFNQMVVGLQERERLREAFGAYVDPEVADRVLAEGTVLEGEELEVSVLFVDVRGFTAFAERSSAREVVEALNRLFEALVPVLRRHGGHANKFIGDGLLAVFGAPERQADHADRAVAAACEAAKLVAARDDLLPVGIGVNSGPVVAGSVGGGGRVEFTVIGDPVNTAARVEAATRETGDAVLVTAATRALLVRDHGGWVDRGAVELRGRQEPVLLHAPVGAVARISA
jgi:adenylate cyclase